MGKHIQIGGFKPVEDNHPQTLAPWEAAINQFADNYEPATSFEEMDDLITTPQLYAILQEFYPTDEYSEKDMVDILEGLGFGYRYHPVLKSIFWLIKQKSAPLA